MLASRLLSLLMLLQSRGRMSAPAVDVVVHAPYEGQQWILVEELMR